MKRFYIILLLFVEPFIFLRTSFGQNSASDILEQALSGVVTVAVYQTSEVGNRPLGVRGSQPTADQAYAKALNLSGAKGSGSGFVVESNGRKYVLTNAHVIESASEASGSLAVFSISQKKYEVRVLGGDALYDVAVLEFVNPPGPELVALSLRSMPARIGERVYAIGNPEGEYPYTVTDGIVSAKNRMRGGLTGKFGFLQTTATVIWGNSGGPLLDERGQILGMNSQIAFTNTPSGEQIWLSQINFALETPIIQRLLADVLANDGLVRRAYLGIEISQVSSSRRTGQSVPESSLPVLSAVLPDSPGKAQLTPHIGQRIVAVNGEEVRSAEEVLGTFETVRPGSSVTLTFQRDQTPSTVTIRAATLTPVQLESIARFAMTSNHLTISDSPGGVVVQLVPDNNLYEMDQDRKFKQSPSMMKNSLEKESTVSTAVATGAKTISGSPAAYRVIAAGLHSERASKLWRVNKLSYLGSVCRLMGLSGVIDVGLSDPDNPQNVRFARKHLSGQEGVTKACLWY